jgi:hypothetical protein
MNPIQTASPPGLRDALYTLATTKAVPDAALLDDMVRRYPQFSGELTDYAIAIAVDALRSDTAVEAAEAGRDPLSMSAMVSRAMSRFQNRLHAVSEQGDVRSSAPQLSGADASNPFAALSRDEFRAFAKRLDVNNVFVAKLRDRQIDPATLTPGFRQRVANDLRAPLGVVVAHFAATQGAPAQAQYYKADGKPTNGGRQCFEEAVQSSGLSEAQQRSLLAL